jgi:hypothetical protein
MMWVFCIILVLFCQLWNEVSWAKTAALVTIPVWGFFCVMAFLKSR